jgi:hypothetical protein
VRDKAMPNLSPSNSKYERMIRIWRQLPLPVTHLIGPLVARHLG